MEDDEISKVAYDAACAAYRDIANHNLAVVLIGGIPTEQDFQREDDACDALETARRALLKSMFRRLETKGPPEGGPESYPIADGSAEQRSHGAGMRAKKSRSVGQR